MNKPIDINTDTLLDLTLKGGCVVTVLTAAFLGLALVAAAFAGVVALWMWVLGS